MEAANRISQRLSYSSTRRNAGGLNCRVRDGYGWNPAAMAALMPTRGIEPRSDCDAVRRPSSVVDVLTTDVRAIQVPPGPASAGQCVQMWYEWWLQPVSARGLNVSLPRRVHPESIDLVFDEWFQRYLFSRWVSSLDAFSSYPVWRSFSATLSRMTDTPVATTRSSSRTIRTFPSGTRHPQ